MRKTNTTPARTGSRVNGSAASRVHPNAAATSVAILRLRIQRVSSLRAILNRLRAQETALESTESGLDPSNQDFNPQVVAAATAALTLAQSQLQTLPSLLAEQSARPPFTRPVRRLFAAARRLQDAATYLHLAVVDLQTGNGGAATQLVKVADALRRARNALNRTQDLLAGVCASEC